MDRSINENEIRSLTEAELDAANISGGIKFWFHSAFGTLGVAANAYQSGSSGAEVLYWLLVP